MNDLLTSVESLTAVESRSVRLAFITGLSNPESCQLSKIQREFLSGLSLPDESKLFLNFPYSEDLANENNNVESEKDVSLWRASLNNGWQFISASTRNYRRLNAHHWKALMDSADLLLLIAGSCGLQLINSLLDESEFDKVRVLAFGPTAWRRPRCKTVLVQGEKDWISKLFFRDVDHVLPVVGHLDYLKNEQFRAIAIDWICSNVSK